MLSLEDQLTTDLTAYWTATRPSGLPSGWSIVNMLATEERVLPCIIIGHEGTQRFEAKSMTGSGRVKLRVGILSDMDETTPDDHRAVAGLINSALNTITKLPGPLPLTYLHDLLWESPETSTEDRRQLTVLRRDVIATQMVEA